MEHSRRVPDVGCAFSFEMNDIKQDAKEDLLGRVGIIGNGSWGTALAKMLTDNQRPIHWWLRNEAAAKQLKERGHNPHYLTSVRFDPALLFPASNLLEICEASDTLVFAVPSAYANEVLAQVPAGLWQNKKIISAIKGILPEHHQLLNDYLQQHCDFDLDQYVAITGPCHAEEVAAERLSYLTFSGLDEALTASAAQAFANPFIYTTHNHDLWGAQLAAVLKNIYAIGAGMAHALDYGDNFLSVFITNCYREMYHFLDAHFHKVHPSKDHPDFLTSAYLGDLLVTCYSLHSRNRRFGTMIGKGYSIQAATLEMNMVAEGYYAARGMMQIAAELDIPLPIGKQIYEVLWENKPAGEMMLGLEKQLS